MHKILHTLAAAPVLPPLKNWFEWGGVPASHRDERESWSSTLCLLTVYVLGFV